MTIADCQEPWRVLTALGAVFFLLGFRFAMLRWRELAIAERRLRKAVLEAENEVRSGVSGLRRTGDSRAAQARSGRGETVAAQDARDSSARPPLA